jgi:hypothetical protein
MVEMHSRSAKRDLPLLNLADIFENIHEYWVTHAKCVGF